MGYFYLFIAICGEVIGTISLKNSEGLTQPVHTTLIVVGYIIAFYFMMLSMRTIPVAISYSIWAGVGITAIAIISAIQFREIPDLYAILGLGFIIVGIVIPNSSDIGKCNNFVIFRSVKFENMKVKPQNLLPLFHPT